MIALMLKYSLALALFYAFYLLLLEKEKMHQFKRFFLLAMLPLALIIPNLVIYTENIVASPASGIDEFATGLFTSTAFLLWIYLPVTGILLIRLGVHVYRMMVKIRKHDKRNIPHASLVLLEEEVLPHSFFNYIFVNASDYQNKKINEELFLHELAHVRQLHSLDILFVELYHALFWFNPALIYVKKSVRVNHEFIADDAVLAVKPEVSVYQHMLLNLISESKTNPLVSTVSYAITRKRFVMMRRNGSRQLRILLRFASIPLIAGSLSLFSSIQNSHENALPGHTHEHESEHHKRSEAESSEGDHHNSEHNS